MDLFLYVTLNPDVFLSVPDIHECVEYGNVCSNGGTCRNLMGGYICTCPIGWTGDNCTIGEKS